MPHFGQTYPFWSGILMLSFVPAVRIRDGVPGRATERSTRPAPPRSPIRRVISTPIHESRSGASSCMAMTGTPFVLSACSWIISVPPWRTSDSVTHGPPLVVGVYPYAASSRRASMRV